MASNTAMIFPLVLIRSAGLPLHWLDDLAAKWPEERIVSESDVADAVRQAFDVVLFALEASPLRTAVYNARRDFFQKRKTPAMRLIQRLYEMREQPEVAQLIDNLSDWEKYQTQKNENYRQYENALNANFKALQKAACEDTLQRSLLFTSHDLLDRLPSFTQKTVENFNKKDRQTALSLLQYLTRAVAKTSPLSRLTAVGLKRAGSSDRQDMELPAIPKSIVTPNVALLPALYEVLLREPAFFQALPVLLNPCITTGQKRPPREQSTTGNQQLKWLYFDGENESFQQMEPNPAADFLVELLLEKGRIMPFSQLISLLENEIDAEPGQLQSLVFELIDFGMLEWDLPEKGLSPSWCAGLYHFLGYLPDQPPVVVETAALLQWMRTAARTLPFRSLEEAQSVQRETVRLVQAFFEKHGGTMPPLSPEQIFFEDTIEVAEDDVPDEVIVSLANNLAECWRQRENRLPSFRAQIRSFAEQNLTEGQTVDFLDFCTDFLGQHEPVHAVAGSHRLNTQAKQKIGALLQIFRDESGIYRAVVNGLFPGGGKLFARWLHLFPSEVGESLKKWNDAIPFPWQGWSNANFQPPVSTNSLAVPGGRHRPSQGGRQVLLGNLAVNYDTTGLQLIDGETGEPLVLTDVGLESPESRPPAMQVTWHLGVPYISLEAVLPHRRWVEGGPHWRYTDRVVSGQLILARKTWQVDAEKIASWLSGRTESDFFSAIRAQMKEMGIPRQFFARYIQEKPQYFDLDSPVSMLLFSKMLRRKKSPLVLTEMLPLPDQCVVRKNGLRASEFVLELEV